MIRLQTEKRRRFKKFLRRFKKLITQNNLLITQNNFVKRRLIFASCCFDKTDGIFAKFL